MKGQVATNSLVRHAVLSEHERVREMAADQLSKRSWFAYVPALLGNLKTPVELDYRVAAFSGGTLCDFALRREGPASIDVLEGALGRTKVESRIGGRKFIYRAESSHFSRLTPVGLRRSIAKTNTSSEKLNQRIYPVLRQATGQQLPDQPQDWWQWWQQENEVYAGRQKPVHRNQIGAYRFTITTVSCFLPGTKVWTDDGPLPIERVRVGDRVLSQDPDTGELTYKLVVDTTVRPPSESVRLGLGDEEVVATLGHPLWVVGEGWVMAKELRVGDRLHSVSGGASIDYIEKGPKSEAHNLVVEGFNTYFVGKQRVLVHDNCPRRPTDAKVPGLRAE
jgi:hypothetical protein